MHLYSEFINLTAANWSSATLIAPSLEFLTRLKKYTNNGRHVFPYRKKESEKKGRRWARQKERVRVCMHVRLGIGLRDCNKSPDHPSSCSGWTVRVGLPELSAKNPNHTVGFFLPFLWSISHNSSSTHVTRDAIILNQRLLQNKDRS